MAPTTRSSSSDLQAFTLCQLAEQLGVAPFEVEEALVERGVFPQVFGRRILDELRAYFGRRSTPTEEAAVFLSEEDLLEIFREERVSQHSSPLRHECSWPTEGRETTARVRPRG